jgi:hypothetical protein
MVRAILEGRKTVTRRVVKPQPVCYGPNITFDPHDDFFLSKEKNWLRCRVCGHDPEYSRSESNIAHHWVPPYRPGDILYVREAWTNMAFLGYQHAYKYKADQEPGMLRFAEDMKVKWRSSIHMPREAARIFLRVAGVKVKRLQTSFFEQGSAIFTLREEGIDISEQCQECIASYGCPCCIDGESECGVLDEVRGGFSDLWNSTIKPADRALYGWQANPWVWVVAFEKVSREEALSCPPTT